ncbi:putative 26S proteasome non-ATPase regulatory subunit 5 [Hypsibius exemplaris]|uniref:26S proteasome non-ATPase regulatory subunit 5 n=1 Tax=Hypsibius exemplaris TaxID=2072580 RepID=A0A1W0WCA2_HYPEX|nr:putative 26S proteasome non-ATPase regulatory subunit 5 [Hypsibius exemplaris]
MSSSSEPILGEIPAAKSGVGSSDLRISSLFQQIARALRSARSSFDLSALRRLLTDITFELTKYGDVPLSGEAWRPRIEAFVTDVLYNVQIPPVFALDIRDIENDTAAMVDHLMESLVEPDGVKDVGSHFQWHLQLASSCAKCPALPRIRAYGYYKLGDLRKQLPITPEVLAHFLPVIIFLLEGFREDDSGIAKAASDASLALVKHFNITNILHPGFEYARKLVSIIDQPTFGGRTEVVKFRIFDFVKIVLAQHLGTVGDVLQLGLMEKLFASFQTMDLLALANNCEAIAEFADHPVGLDLLEESGGMRIAEDLLVAKKDSSELEYFAPYLFRLYISLAIKHPEYCILKREKVTHVARDLILQQGGHSGAAALEYISQLASQSHAGKRYLHNLIVAEGEGNGKPFMTPILEFMGKRLSGTITQDPMDDACLRCFALLVRRVQPLTTPESDAELQSINQAWFTTAGRGLFTALFQKVRNPFKDVKIPVMAVFRSLAEQRWGLEVFRAEPGFLEYLMNRKSETDKEIKELKFDVVKAVTESAALAEVLDSVTIVRLREFVQDGPFYVPGEYQVASEGAS